MLYYLFMYLCYGLMLFPSIRECLITHGSILSAFFFSFSIRDSVFSLDDFPGLFHYIHG